MSIISNLSPHLTQSKPLLRRAYVVLCMLGHYYMHGTSPDSSTASKQTIVPAPIATPWLFVSSLLDAQPALSYAAEILWNCSLPSSSTSASDLKVLNMFTNHPSEEAFILAPARVELEGATCIRSIFEILVRHLHSSSTIPTSDLQTLITSSLHTIQTSLQTMVQHLQALKTSCDPTHFYYKLRPWIAGTGDAGWTYTLTSPSATTSTVQKILSGSTAGSSALLQSLDAFLDITSFSDSKSTQFRKDMRAYMPPGHVKFIHVLEDINQQSSADSSTLPSLRTFVQASSSSNTEEGRALVAAYNAVVEGVKAFRDEHFRVVARFVIAQARKEKVGMKEEEGKEEALQGTGGSDLARLLKGLRDGTGEAVLE